MTNQNQIINGLLDKNFLPIFSFGFAVGIGILLCCIITGNNGESYIFITGSSLSWTLGWMIGVIIALINRSIKFDEILQFAIHCWYGGAFIVWLLLHALSLTNFSNNANVLLLLYLGCPALAALIIQPTRLKP